MRAKYLAVAPMRAARPQDEPQQDKQIKRAPFAVSRIQSDGTFSGYASLFGLADLGGDIVMPGAFAQSLRRRGPAGVKLLWQHDAAHPIGVWLSLVEDARGLKAQGKLNLDVAKARDVFALMREGAIDGLSIGYRAERTQLDKATQMRRLYRIDLWEISVVTFPMLPQARVDAVKRGSSFADGETLAARRSARIAGALRRAAATMR